ncbi:dymeclin-like [Tubulanus polymorphus]|uniref:dymeclin-like n=1 Tax=Tubulanus polymorphus TaxID=672921 RepID=UPI003DA401E6
MGVNSSSISELQDNEYLKRLCGVESICPNDPFWNQLLSFQFQPPNDVSDMRLLEESTMGICKNFAINNCRTGNFGSLVRVFLRRAAELKASAQTEDNVFVWQTYNALFIIRNICKYFIENLSEEVILDEFETRPSQLAAPASNTSANADGAGSVKLVADSAEGDEETLADEFMSCLIELLVDVPVVGFTYSLHLESLNTLFVLLSLQMFTTQPACTSTLYRFIMQGKCSIHACLLMKTLLQNYIKQEKCPEQLSKPGGSSMLYNATVAVASGLWTVVTLGLAKGQEAPSEETPAADAPLLANQSLLLMLILTNHCTSGQSVHNPYRQALFSFTNSQEQDSQTSSDPTEAVATFKIDYSQLYDAMCQTLKDDQTTLLLYTLLHRNAHVKAFILSRTNVDQLVMPVLKILYHAQEKNSHHIYMALIIILVLSEDEVFNKSIHEMRLKNITWFKERQITEITLGGLLILVVIRTIQFNMTRMRDKYLHTNCLAALANMSSQFKALHPYVSQRLISLFSQLCKKHTKLIEQIQHAASQETRSVESGSETDLEQEHLQDLSVLEEVIRMVLEIVNSCLTHALHHNPNLVYTLLYKRELFAYFRTHPTFQDIIQNIDTVLAYFSSRLEQTDSNLSVEQVRDVIEQGIRQFSKTKLKKFPELKFKYVEEESPEEFFIPYVWSLVYHSSHLYFNSSRIQLFTLSTTTVT